MEIIPKKILLESKKSDIIYWIKYLNDCWFIDVEISKQSWISKTDISNFKNQWNKYSVSIKKCDTILGKLNAFIKIIK